MKKQLLRVGHYLEVGVYENGLPLLPYPISNAVLGILVVLVDGEELHRPSPPALVHRAGLRQGQNLPTQQVSLHDRGARRGVNLERNGIATCG